MKWMAPSGRKVRGGRSHRLIRAHHGRVCRGATVWQQFFGCRLDVVTRELATKGTSLSGDNKLVISMTTISSLNDGDRLDMVKQ